MAEHINCEHDPETVEIDMHAAVICSPSGTGPQISSHPDCECPGGVYRRFVDRSGTCPLHGTATGSSAGT